MQYDMYLPSDFRGVLYEEGLMGESNLRSYLRIQLRHLPLNREGRICVQLSSDSWL